MSGRFNENLKEWSWDPVTWKKNSNTGLLHSNREYPKKFWHYSWDKRPKDIAGVLLLRKTDKDPTGHEVFVVQCYGDKFGFPKGKLNHKENPLDGAKREFLEESGTLIDLKAQKELKIQDIRFKRNIVFYVHIVNKDFEIETTPLADVEITAFGWIGISKIKNINLSNLAKRVINRSINHLNIENELLVYNTKRRTM